jgi:hypothetical protein
MRANQRLTLKAQHSIPIAGKEAAATEERACIEKRSAV